MRYCGECGAELKDNDLFCGECGAKQELVVLAESPVIETYQEEKDNAIIASDTQKKAVEIGKIPGWVVIIALILCSPLSLAFLTVDLLLILPEVAFWIIYFGLQIVALAMMCCKKSWNMWIKVIVVALYVLSYII